ncbi:unnamed protein product, partial [Cladocopium goreaui]
YSRRSVSEMLLVHEQLGQLAMGRRHVAGPMFLDGGSRQTHLCTEDAGGRSLQQLAWMEVLRGRGYRGLPPLQK